jgi:16S rRNA (adenine1518-N6/adenine1519-N6)-dimethyltransferase
VTLTETKRALAEIGLEPTRSLGQNFLVDQNILPILLEAAELQPGETVIEIGAGLGALTQALLAAGAEVVAVEKDARLVAFLGKRFAGRKRLQLIPGDALEAGLIPATGDYKLVANLPYAVSTAILKRFVEAGRPPRRIVAMLQREVGDRLAAKPGTADYSMLTVFTQMRYRVSLRHRVSRRCFHPAPDVDSAVVLMEYQPHPLLASTDAERLAQVVRAGFAQRRKQFAKLLRQAGCDAERVEQAFATLGLPGAVRAEALSVEQFLLLTKELSRGRNV